MIIDSIKDYFALCPYLAEGKININCLGEKTVSYSIDNVAAEPVIKKYCDGAVLKQFVFDLAIRDIYDENLFHNLKIAQLFEQIEGWILEQNRKGILPDIDCGIPVKLEVTKSGSLYDSNIESGRWQIEMRLVYRQN